MESKRPADRPVPAAPVLARASESGDAGVQQLLALREIHLCNGDEERAAGVAAQLRDLGFQ